MDFKTPETPIARVASSAVRAALHFAADGDARYYLNGIQVRPAQQGGALVIAADGHVMLCVHDRDGACAREVIVPLSKREHARLLSPRVELWVGEDGHARTVEAATKQVEWISPKGEIEGKFPDVSSMVGDLAAWKPGLVGTFNPHLLDKVKASAKGNRFPDVRFFHRTVDGTQAALFTMRLGMNNAFGLVMPMRDTMRGLEDIVPVEFRSAA